MNNYKAKFSSEVKGEQIEHIEGCSVGVYCTRDRTSSPGGGGGRGGGGG